MVNNFDLKMAESEISICGFRSLLNFSITLNSGLNILVGPNGSGKTNFIQFLDFLDDCFRFGASTAVSNAGGVNRVFSHENMKKSSPELSACIRALAATSDDPGLENYQGPKYFKFEYRICVRFSKANSLIYIRSESIRFFKMFDLGHDLAISNGAVGLLSLTRRSPALSENPKWVMGPRLRASNFRNPLHIGPDYLRRQVDEFVHRGGDIPLSVDESMLSSRSRIPAIDIVRSAMTRGRSFNISPDQARSADDIIRTPGISQDGSGLSSTLHYLQNRKQGKVTRPPYRLRGVSRSSLNMIVHWTRIIFPELESISVASDPFTGKYIGYFLIYDDKSLKIPFQSASDGTLKWLSIITLILTSTGSYSIEEPENFLYPRMQQLLIHVIRESLDGDVRPRSFVLSTHSETLIHECRPEELIIFSFDAKGTQCRRVSNPDQVQEEINKTGFGLGFYYASNALS